MFYIQNLNNATYIIMKNFIRKIIIKFTLQTPGILKNLKSKMKL